MQSGQFRVHAEMELEHWWFVGRRTIMRNVVHHVLPPSKTSRVVDVGCGTGANIASLAGDYDCVGIDPTREAIQYAQERFPQVRFLCAAAPGAVEPLLEGAGLVLLMDVLEHVPDDFGLFSDLLSALRPGSFVLVTVPALMSLWSEHDVSFGHHRRYEREGLAEVWAGLPVRVCLLSHFNARLYPVIRALRALNRARGRTSGEARTDFHIPAPFVNEALKTILAGESGHLLDMLRGKGIPAYRRGASLIALLRREEGGVGTRVRGPAGPFRQGEPS